MDNESRNTERQIQNLDEKILLKQKNNEMIDKNRKKINLIWQGKSC